MMQNSKHFFPIISPSLQALCFKALPFIVKTPTQTINKSKKSILKFMSILVENASFFLLNYDLLRGSPVVL